jgi:lipopolysaccharide export system protein LptC
MSAGSGRAPGGAVAAGRLRHYRAGAGSIGAPGRYSGFVGLMRYLLPAMAAALLGLVVAWPLFSDGQEGFRIALSEDTGIDGRLTMIKASYQGTDTKNRPFVIRGEEAFQSDSDSPIVHISGIGADIFADRARNGKLAMTAREGVYDREAERLDLEGDVTVRSDAGHEFHTASARIDLPAGIATGDEPVNGKGPHGLLDAGNFTLKDRGQIMMFGGRVRMTVFPHAGGGVDGDAGRRSDGISG